MRAFRRVKRRDYNSPVYTPDVAADDPFVRFGELLERARATDLSEPNAFTIATVDSDGRPSARVVLLRGFDARGFVFYTNLESRKARELQSNPHAALCFYWLPLDVQVRIEGAVQQVDDAEADSYFASRPRGSQIGAWASLQSSVLPSRAELEERVRDIEARFADRDVPRPPFWSGLRVAPERMEFWYGQPSRLHHRDVYTRRGDGWTLHHLYP
jgi:pyridoxamine 5'-phosphate oxidase